MISREKMEYLADFVLRFFNCRRVYSIDIVKDTDLDGLLNQVKVIKPSCKIKAKFEKEHGSEYAKKVQSGEWNLECITVVLESDKEPKFCIVVFKEPFSKRPRGNQMLNIIHEARHIAEYPKVTSEMEYGDLDILLLKEYLEERWKSEELIKLVL